MNKLPEMLDNINKTVNDDLTATIKKGDKLSIAAACFSIYAYQALKKQLESISELRFIFTSPTFLEAQVPKEQREFYIPRLNRERSLYGTDFEVKLRNELTQKAIARECSEWITKKVKFRSNFTSGNITPFLNVSGARERVTYTSINGFTTADIGCERGNNIINPVMKVYSPTSDEYLRIFNSVWNNKDLLQDVTEQIITEISTAYKENSPEFIYFVAIYNIFNEFLEDINEDVLPNECTGFKETAIWNKLYEFQRDAVLAIINKLEKYNGCILADSVGLGKTFSALAVIKYYELRNRNVLVLCPKKLGDNWQTFNSNVKNNPLLADRLRYDVLYHTDLSREGGMSNGHDLSKWNWDNYDLVVIDESHNFRNGGEMFMSSENERRENRYLKLLNKVIRKGVKTKVLMLSATPVNNGFSDLKHQLALAYEGNPDLINDRLGTRKPIDAIFKQAQTTFNKWCESPAEKRTTESLLKALDFDFFTMLDCVTIARSRKHIEKYYNMAEIGKFPERMKPISLRPPLTDLPSAINYSDIYTSLMKLNLSVYSPMAFVFPTMRSKYVTDPENKGDILRITGHESGIRRLMAVNLLKRLESSIDSFRLTIRRIETLINDTIARIENYKGNSMIIDATELDENSFDGDDQNTDYFSYGKHRKIDLEDVDCVTWLIQLKEDAETLELLRIMTADITPEHDSKLQKLIEVIREKVTNPLNGENKKILLFSAFSDTVEYLYKNVSPLIKKEFGFDTAMLTGDNGKTTAKVNANDINFLLTLFSPNSKDKSVLCPNEKASIDILIATDCISEGQNLQDCDFCINYDIHWNPVRIIQRFGRIDRIGSMNKRIQLVNFWPDVNLDEYLNLKGRVESRLKASVLAATGDDNLIDPKEKGDLEYRKSQLERLREEVVDLEEMQSGISIMDLGLNEFRLDLLEYIKHNGDLDKVPFGLHAVVKSNEDVPLGTIFILKNKNAVLNNRSQNQLHPFYMVYVRDGSNIYIDHLQPKKLLDVMRKLCKGKTTPDMELCNRFNEHTKDGQDMSHYSALLYFTVKSIVDINEGNVLDGFLQGNLLNFSQPTVAGLDDFELVCFLTVK